MPLSKLGHKRQRNPTLTNFQMMKKYWYLLSLPWPRSAVFDNWRTTEFEKVQLEEKHSRNLPAMVATSFYVKIAFDTPKFLLTYFYIS